MLLPGEPAFAGNCASFGRAERRACENDTCLAGGNAGHVVRNGASSLMAERGAQNDRACGEGSEWAERSVSSDAGFGIGAVETDDRLARMDRRMAIDAPRRKGETTVASRARCVWQRCDKVHSRMRSLLGSARDSGTSFYSILHNRSTDFRCHGCSPCEL